MLDRDFPGEYIELEAAVDMYAAGAAYPELGCSVHPIDGGVALAVAALPGILFNRVIGLGLTEPATRATLEAITMHYAALGTSEFLLHVHPDARPAELPSWLGELGFVPFRRAWVKFERGDEPVSERGCDLRIERIAAPHADEFGRIVASTFHLPEAAALLIRALPERPGWSAYMCFDGDKPAAAAAMFEKNGLAWFGYAATLSEYRQRGSQSALLARRIKDALERGCRRLFVETGEAVEGDPQRSYKNIERSGFRRIYKRDNHLLAKTTG